MCCALHFIPSSCAHDVVVLMLSTTLPFTLCFPSSLSSSFSFSWSSPSSSMWETRTLRTHANEDLGTRTILSQHEGSSKVHSCRVPHFRQGVCSNDRASITARRPCSAGRSLIRKYRRRSGSHGHKLGRELEALCSTSSGWIFFVGHLLQAHLSTSSQWRSRPVGECVSITKGPALGMKVRSPLVEYGLTLKVACETSAGRATVTHVDATSVVAASVVRRTCGRRAQACRAQRSRPGNKDG